MLEKLKISAACQVFFLTSPNVIDFHLLFHLKEKPTVCCKFLHDVYWAPEKTSCAQEFWRQMGTDLNFKCTN